MSLRDDDSQVLSDFGTRVISNTLALVVESLLYGVYIVLFCVAVHSQMKKTKSWPVLATTLAIVTMFLLSTALLAISVADVVVRTRAVLVLTEGTVASRLEAVDKPMQGLWAMEDSLYTVLYVIGDTVIAWRLITLRPGSKIVLFVIFTLWFGTLVTGLGVWISFIVALHKGDVSSFLPAMQCEDASWVLSLTFNGLAVVLLGQLCFVHRRSRELVQSATKTSATNVLTVLVVAGLIYFALGIPRLSTIGISSKVLTATLRGRMSAYGFATEITQFMMYQLVGLYPTAVTAVLYFTVSAPLTLTETPVLPTLSLHASSPRLSSDV